MGESDYGLDLLVAIIATELKAADFSPFQGARCAQSYQGGRYGRNQAGLPWLLCGGLGFLFQREFPAKFHAGSISDCGVPY